MRRFGIIYLTLLASMLIFLSGCEVVKGIFEMGFWVGVILVVFVLGVIIFLITRIF